jgi:hypothetical protein
MGLMLGEKLRTPSEPWHARKEELDFLQERERLELCHLSLLSFIEKHGIPRKKMNLEESHESDYSRQA